MGAVRNQNMPPEEQNFDEMGIHPRKGSIKESRFVTEIFAFCPIFKLFFFHFSSDEKFERTFSFMRKGSNRKKDKQSEDEVCIIASFIPNDPLFFWLQKNPVFCWFCLAKVIFFKYFTLF